MRPVWLAAVVTVGTRREERFYGATQLPNFLRAPDGPGWALVGDAGYEQQRNAATLPDYHRNLSLARFEPMPEQQRRLRAALRGDQAVTNHFFLAIQGLVDAQTFFDDENLGRIVSGAAVA